MVAEELRDSSLVFMHSRTTRDEKEKQILYLIYAYSSQQKLSRSWDRLISIPLGRCKVPIILRDSLYYQEWSIHRSFYYNNNNKIPVPKISHFGLLLCREEPVYIAMTKSNPAIALGKSILILLDETIPTENFMYCGCCTGQKLYTKL